MTECAATRSRSVLDADHAVRADLQGLLDDGRRHRGVEAGPQRVGRDGLRQLPVAREVRQLAARRGEAVLSRREPSQVGRIAERVRQVVHQDHDGVVHVLLDLGRVALGALADHRRGVLDVARTTGGVAVVAADQLDLGELHTQDERVGVLRRELGDELVGAVALLLVRQRAAPVLGLDLDLGDGRGLREGGGGDGEGGGDGGDAKNELDTIVTHGSSPFR